MTFAEAHCTNPACKTITELVVDDSATTLKCGGCNQYNAILSRRHISNGRCARCNGRPLDDHRWVGEQAVCRTSV